MGCSKSRAVAGVDIGAATAKAVILSGNQFLSFSIIPTGFSVASSAESVIEDALQKSGLSSRLSRVRVPSPAPLDRDSASEPA